MEVSPLGFFICETMNIQHVIHWINERYRLFADKTYTSHDYRMNQIRFCNVHRENDRVTRALRSTWMKKEDAQLDLPFISFLARRLNTVKAFNEVARPKQFDLDYLVRHLEAHDKSIHMKAGIYTVYPVKGKGHLWSDAYFTSKNYTEFSGINLKGASLAESYKEILKFDRVGSFFAGQMLGDLKNTSYLKDASDWWDWAAIGPGSRRGLNRIFGDDLECVNNDKLFLDRLSKVREAGAPHLDSSIPRICLQDMQNVMCETDKYLRFYDVPDTGLKFKSNN